IRGLLVFRFHKEQPCKTMLVDEDFTPHNGVVVEPLPPVEQGLLPLERGVQAIVVRHWRRLVGITQRQEIEIEERVVRLVYSTWNALEICGAGEPFCVIQQEFNFRHTVVKNILRRQSQSMREEQRLKSTLVGASDIA